LQSGWPLTVEMIARNRIDDRTQNALPVWYTHSTVTGSETALGHDVKKRAESSSAAHRRSSDQNRVDPERDLEAHYAALMGDEESEEDDDEDDIKPIPSAGPEVKLEPGLVEEDIYPEEEDGYSASATPMTGTANVTANGTPVGDSDEPGAGMVMGKPASLWSGFADISGGSPETIRRGHR